MVVCKECGNMRSEVLRVCGGCLAKARGETPRDPLPMSPEYVRIAQAFLGGVRQAMRKAVR